MASYWRKLKQRLIEEGNETVTNCHGLKMRAEVTTTEISKKEDLEGFSESLDVAKVGGDVAGSARIDIEKRLKKRVVTKKNSKDIINSNKELQNIKIIKK
ncbi:MAG: hypothetical protein PF542_06185 [Nanoarchaeota archaeon]|jgi:hypothetical protein|nr:hypothetical protein [Nanoarchaeota archaeon]